MKRIVALLLILALLTGLTGCHGSRGLKAFEMPDEFDTSRTYEITFWAKNDTNLTQVAIYEQAISDFQAIYPNIRVNLRLYTDYSRIYNDVITNISTNTTPNVCISYPDHIATYLTGTNTVVPLTELMQHEEYGLGGSAVAFDAPTARELIGPFLAECAIGQEYYALPFMRSTECCYVNKTYVEALGYELPEVLTWDFVWEVSAAAMEQDADGNYLVNGQKTMIPFIYKSTDNMMITMLRQLGAGYTTEDGTLELFHDETEGILYAVADAASQGAFSTFKISSYPGNFLNAGQCIFAIDSTAGATWMGSEAPLIDISEDKLVDFEMAVLPVPQYDTENLQMISQGPSVCIFNKADAQEVLASWLFVQYLLTNEVQIAYAQTEGYVPVTSKAQQSAEYQDYLSRAGEDGEQYYWAKIEASRLLLDHVDDTFTTAVFNGSASVRDAAGQMIENVTKSVRRGETVDAAYMENLFSSMVSLYRLDQLGQDSAADRTDMGPMPHTAKVLLVSLGAAWVLMGLWVLWEYLSKKSRRKSHKSY